ncbi:MAG TPA: hypothetical protein VFC24_06255 [Casimicrobiaceae bacterium]|nr:hypothetical protein [Casimicrobiaceae bacterium]
MKTAVMLAVLCSFLLAGCGGGNGSGNVVNDQSGGKAKLESLLTVPNISAGTNFSFDLGDVDPQQHRYYFTDRNNKSVDVYDTQTGALIAVITGGFAGAGPSSDSSGPDGINVIPNSNFAYVGDVNSVKVIDTRINAVVKTIPVSSSGLRADEGCFDPDDNIYMISSPGDNPPFATFISTLSQTVIAQLKFPDSAGLEACAYDPTTKSFFVNNDGTTANAHGELDAIPAASVVAGKPAVSKAYALGNCDPTGLALGPGSDIASECRPGTPGTPLNMLILNRTTGAVLANIAAGGGDQIWYDSSTNRYYVAANRWTPNGLAVASCSAATPCTPVLTLVDAGTRTVIGSITAGNNAHSVAVDPLTHRVFMPFSSSTNPAGCVNCDLFGNGAGGVAVYLSPPA